MTNVSAVKTKRIRRYAGAEADRLIANDGVDFFNIFSGGKTRLGRLATHFANTPIDHPRFGWFKSLEGLYYWLIAEVKDESLRRLDGWEAKKHGRTLPAVHVDNLIELMDEANRLKVEQHPELKELLRNSTLPFKHFYYYGKRPGKYVVYESEEDWLCTIYTRIREELHNETISPETDGG